METLRRRAVRAVLLAPGGAVLLVRLREPERGEPLWFAPGGGIRRGESPEEALRREVHEETGLAGVVPEAHVWVREHAFRWAGRRIVQREDFYLVRTERFAPHTEGMEPAEREVFEGFGWWSAAAIEASPEGFVPRRLARHLRELLHTGLPREPVDVGS